VGDGSWVSARGKGGLGGSLLGEVGEQYQWQSQSLLLLSLSHWGQCNQSWQLMRKRELWRVLGGVQGEV